MLHPRLWRDDHSAARCTGCEAIFSLFRCRRHHCRHCGGVFCDACTEKRLWLRPVPPPSRSRHVETSSARGSPAEIPARSGVVTPTAVPASSLLNRAPSLNGAKSSISVTSKNAARRSRANSSSTGGDEAEATLFTRSSSAGSLYAVPLPRQSPQGPQRAPAMETQPPKREQLAERRDDVPAHVRGTKDDGAGKWERSRSSSTTTMTTATVHHRGSNSGRFNAPCAEAEMPALPSAPRPRNEGNAPTENSGCRFVSAKSMATASAAPPPSRTPSQGNSHTQEMPSVHHSRRVSSSLYSASINAISPSTATGEVPSQVWATPEVMVGFEQGFSSHLLRGSSATHGGGASGCASLMSDSLLNHRCLFEHHDDQQQSQQGVAAGDGGTLNCSLETRKGKRIASAETALATARGSDANSGGSASGSIIDNDDAYRRESYKVEVDSVRCITWYLCRVCRRCYDHLADSILDAHEAPHAAATLHSSSKLPLWYYARFCSSSELLGTDGRIGIHLQRRGCEAPRYATSKPSAASLCPTAAVSSRSLPSWSSIWARVRASVSLPACRALSTMTLPAMKAAATPSSASASPLQTRDHCQARGAASRRLSERTSTNAAGVQASTGLGGSGYTSPVSLESARGDDSILSLSARPAIKSPKIASAQPQLPQPSSSSTRARRTVTPPRRLLISIDGSPGPLRQAVALARRRRRIAVILIDERDLAAANDGTEAPQQHQETPFGTLSAHPYADVDAETALRSSSVTDQSSGTQTAVQAPPIAATAGITSPAPQCTESEKYDAHQQNQATDSNTAPAAMTKTSARRPKLSIRVDDVTFDDADGTAAACASGNSTDAAALRGLAPAAWLLPQLPLQAAAPVSPFIAARASSPALSSFLLHENASLVTTVPSSVGAAAVASSSATSKPISCLPDGPQAATSFAVNGEGVPATPHTEGKLPALPVALDSGVCVLRALGFFADPANCASSQTVVTPLCGTGPESYAAQRQALVREMVLRYQLGLGAAPPDVMASPLTAALISGAYTVAGDQNEGAHWCGATGQRGVPVGLGSSSGSYVNAACRRVCGCPAAASFERMMAPVEIVGIPIDTSAVTGATALTAATAAAPSAVSMVSPGLSSPHVRGGGIGAGTAIIPGLTAGDTVGGTSRPFTMAEFLPQLAKLSTNLDGYVIVILRRQSSRCAGGGDRTSPGGGATATRPGPNCDSAGDAPQGADADQLASSACVSLSLLEETKCSVPRPLQLRGQNQRQRRCHRVTELFGGQHIRLLYQQLQSCGVPQPAVSVVEVSNEAEPGAPKLSPVYLVSGKSPLEEASLSHNEPGTPSMLHLKVRAGNGGEDGVAEGWSGAAKPSPQNSALSASGMSMASSVDSGLMRRPSSVSTSATAQSPQATDRAPHAPSMHGDCFERLQLPASVGIALSQTAKVMNTSAFPVVAPNALEQAMTSLRCVSRQLGVSMCSMTYASETAPRPMSSASASYSSQCPAVPTATMAAEAPVPAVPSSPASKANNNASGIGESALLTRALESLVATLVYRDICVTLSQ
ncbi:FYVE zinc finger family protein [Leishmania donovani]|uniref:FYVE zinc finger family protein n=1 Tax=Leishmania donovani TaxID=5661 RepID=A0A504WWW8_LEIDO|nr:FYVE zinc finger family protein [Leishmania donovani]